MVYFHIQVRLMNGLIALNILSVCAGDKSCLLN